MQGNLVHQANDMELEKKAAVIVVSVQNLGTTLDTAFTNIDTKIGGS